MQGVLEIHDTLRSVLIPAACDAVGKMEANRQGSAFSATALWLWRGRALSFYKAQAFVHIHTHTQTHTIFLFQKENVCFLYEVNQICISECSVHACVANVVVLHCLDEPFIIDGM